MENYKTEIKVNCSSNKLFNAITKELSNWWCKQDSIGINLGDIFTVSWGEPWYKFKVIECIENKQLVWRCIDANQKIEGLNNIEKEWVGTKIHWSIVETSIDKCILDFTHEGLNSSLLCFNFCSKTWSHFLNNSLVKYVEE